MVVNITNMEYSSSASPERSFDESATSKAVSKVPVVWFRADGTHHCHLRTLRLYSCTHGRQRKKEHCDYTIIILYVTNSKLRSGTMTVSIHVLRQYYSIKLQQREIGKLHCTCKNGIPALFPVFSNFLLVCSPYCRTNHRIEHRTR